MDIYIVTGTGPLIDTICEVFKSEEEASLYLENEWKKLGKHALSELTCAVWKTDDEWHQNIEWEIHKKTI